MRRKITEGRTKMGLQKEKSKEDFFLGPWFTKLLDQESKRWVFFFSWREKQSGDNHKSVREGTEMPAYLPVFMGRGTKVAAFFSFPNFECIHRNALYFQCRFYAWNNARQQPHIQIVRDDKKYMGLDKRIIWVKIKRMTNSSAQLQIYSRSFGYSWLFYSSQNYVTMRKKNIAQR